jgi:hypothetical protein
MEITFIKPYFQLYDEFAHHKFPKFKKKTSMTKKIIQGSITLAPYLMMC